MDFLFYALEENSRQRLQSNLNPNALTACSQLTVLYDIYLFSRFTKRIFLFFIELSVSHNCDQLFPNTSIVSFLCLHVKIKNKLRTMLDFLINSTIA